MKLKHCQNIYVLKTPAGTDVQYYCPRTPTPPGLKLTKQINAHFQMSFGATWMVARSADTSSTCACPIQAGLPCCTGTCPTWTPLYETMEGGPGPSHYTNKGHW